MAKAVISVKQATKRGRGRPASDNPMRTVSLRFSDKLIAGLDRWAKENDVDRSTAVRQAIIRLVYGRNTKNVA